MHLEAGPEVMDASHPMLSSAMPPSLAPALMDPLLQDQPWCFLAGSVSGWKALFPLNKAVITG